MKFVTQNHPEGMSVLAIAGVVVVAAFEDIEAGFVWFVKEDGTGKGGLKEGGTGKGGAEKIEKGVGYGCVFWFLMRSVPCAKNVGVFFFK